MKSLLLVAASTVLASAVACGSSSDEGGGATDAPLPDASVDAAVDATSTSTVDASTSDAADSATDAGSRCTVSDKSVFCTHNVTPLTAGSVTRDVYWQTPTTPAPAAGYPVVVLFQGSFGGPSVTWATLTPTVPFGGFYQGLLQAMLLDAGFTVIAPEAAAGIAWQTNSGLPWNATTDKDVIDALLVAINAGTYGPADAKRFYAAGISSGGYMTSRMAVSYAGVFRALAIQSGGYATCAGPVCNVPSTLPADHPPTLFLHGEIDTTVPLYTMTPYYDELVAGGFVTKKVLDPNAGHEWLKVSPAEVTAWFTSH